MSRQRFARSLAPVALLALSLPALLGAAQQGRIVSAKIDPIATVFEGVAGETLPFEAPQSFAIDSQGNVVLIDAQGNRLYKLDPKGKVLWNVAGTPGKRFGILGDLFVDAKNQIWVLDGRNDAVVLFSADGKFVRSVPVQRHPRRFVINSAGEIVVNVGRGPKLFDVYSASGKLLRSFGERKKYPNETSDFELNTGSMAAGPRGELYIALNYPPVVQAYSAAGKLLWEAKVPFDPPLPKPKIEVQAVGDGRIAASFEYQVASLDLAVDRAGRVLCLVGGMPRVLVRQGSSRIETFGPDGRGTGSVTLPVSAAGMAVHPQGLFLLEIDKNRVIALTRFALKMAA